MYRHRALPKHMTVVEVVVSKVPRPKAPGVAMRRIWSVTRTGRCSVQAAVVLCHCALAACDYCNYCCPVQVPPATSPAFQGFSPSARAAPFGGSL